MKFSWNRLALLVGAFVLALTAVDGLVGMHRSATATYGTGYGPLVAADSAVALFLMGLVAGMVIGIGIFFGYLVWRERRLAREPDEVSLLLEEVAAEERRSAVHREREDYSGSDEKSETLDPWERPADWWKNTNED